VKLRAGQFEFVFPRPALVMGIVNVTPDSFFDGGRFLDAQAAVDHALQLVEQGAEIIDVGGESTRPGALPVAEPEELRRVMPVLHGILQARPETVISVDTYKAGVARAAVGAGAEIVNDVSAFQWDPEMGRTCAELQCGVVLMHTRGQPEEWRNLSRDPNITELVEHDLANLLLIALHGGVQRPRIVLDPGFGFGKNFEENYPLLAHFDRLQRFGFPLLAGTSRKSFVGRSVGQRAGKDAPPSERLYGSVAAMVASILRGAHVVRVHDVKPAVEAAAVADAVLAAAGGA